MYGVSECWLSINMSKTKEIVFHRPHPSKYSLPNVLSNVEHVVVKLLGIYLMDTLSMSEHVQQSIKVCNQRLYCGLNTAVMLASQAEAIVDR